MFHRCTQSYPSTPHSGSCIQYTCEMRKRLSSRVTHVHLNATTYRGCYFHTAVHDMITANGKAREGDVMRSETDYSKLLVLFHVNKSTLTLCKPNNGLSNNHLEWQTFWHSRNLLSFSKLSTFSKFEKSS